MSQGGRVPSEIDNVIRTGARYTHVLNKISAADVVERGRVGVYELFTYHPQEYIWNNDSGTVDIKNSP